MPAFVYFNLLETPGRFCKLIHPAKLADFAWVIWLVQIRKLLLEGDSVEV